MCETVRLGIKMLKRDKDALRRLAQAEGEAMAVVVRRLIRKEAQERGLLPTQAQALELGATQTQEVRK